jgi:hypothetical protein
MLLSSSYFARMQFFMWKLINWHNYLNFWISNLNHFCTKNIIGYLKLMLYFIVFITF